MALKPLADIKTIQLSGLELNLQTQYLIREYSVFAVIGISQKHQLPIYKLVIVVSKDVTIGDPMATIL